MEEAFFALSQSPTHLPIHIRMAEILTAENKIQAAIDKYTMVAQTYRARGELVRAGRITQQVLRLSPLDVSMRSWLIELLVEQHKTEEALQQFFELADTYYQVGRPGVGAHHLFGRAAAGAGKQRRAELEREAAAQVG